MQAFWGFIVEFWGFSFVCFPLIRPHAGLKLPSQVSLKCQICPLRPLFDKASIVCLSRWWTRILDTFLSSNIRESVRWSAVPMPRLRRLCLMLREGAGWQSQRGWWQTFTHGAKGIIWIKCTSVHDFGQQPRRWWNPVEQGDFCLSVCQFVHSFICLFTHPPSGLSGLKSALPGVKTPLSALNLPSQTKIHPLRPEICPRKAKICPHKP